TRLFDRRAGAGRAREIDRSGERPVIVAGRRALMGDRAVAYRQIAARIAERRGGMVEKEGAHLGAGEAHRDAAELDRLAPGGIALVRGQIGVAGLEPDPPGRDVEFLGGDLL